MQRLKIIILGLGIAAVLIVVALFLIGYFNPKKAGLVIETNPSSNVFIDNELVGRTKYETTRDAGEIVIKLVPESFEVPLSPYETKVKLVSGIKTIINHDFGDSEKTSGGVIISFEDTGESAGISVVSVPDAAQVSIDGQIRGFTPFKSSTISAGEHTIAVSAEGYEEKSISVRTQDGYKLTALFNLIEKEGELVEETEATPEPEVEEVFYVEIANTPTGFLRVRAEPSTLAKELGQVEPNERYDLIDTDEETGWFKIEFEEGKDGWVSNRYAKKVSSLELETTPTPKASPEVEEEE